jgi:hypothetical protein
VWGLLRQAHNGMRFVSKDHGLVQGAHRLDQTNVQGIIRDCEAQIPLSDWAKGWVLLMSAPQTPRVGGLYAAPKNPSQGV